MKKSIIATYNKKGGFYVGIREVPYTDENDLKAFYHRELSMCDPKKLKEVFGDVELYKIAEYDDLNAELIIIPERVFIISVSPYCVVKESDE